jgi:pimeloyl-ACP methyl ester carboxylesterase
MAYLARPDGARLYYEAAGQGPRVLLVHGGTGSRTYDWEFQLPWLLESYRVISFDLRAHGRSTDPQGFLSMGSLGTDTLALVDEVGGSVAAALAFSAGATGLLLSLARNPARASAFGGLILVAASLKGGDAAAIQRSRWPADLMNIRHEAWPEPEHWKLLRLAISSSWAQTVDISRAQMAAITCPILAVAGAADRVEPPATAAAIAAWAPNARAVMLPGTGHFAMRESPDQFRAVVKPFLELVSSPTTRRRAPTQTG